MVRLLSDTPELILLASQSRVVDASHVARADFRNPSVPLHREAAQQHGVLDGAPPGELQDHRARLRDKTDAAYNRTDLFARRRELMDTWTKFATAKTADVIWISGA
jgi:hypothetical protein